MNILFIKILERMHGMPRIVVGKNKQKTYPVEICTLDPYWEDLVSAGAIYDKSDTDCRIKNPSKKK